MRVLDMDFHAYYVPFIKYATGPTMFGMLVLRRYQNSYPLRKTESFGPTFQKKFMQDNPKSTCQKTIEIFIFSKWPCTALFKRYLT